jgi:hypothetical protein
MGGPIHNQHIQTVMANTRVQQQTLVDANLPDNSTNLITPEKHREVETESISASAFVDDDNTFTGSNTFQDVTIFNKKVRWKKGSNLASASTLVPGTTGNTFLVTGTTTISAIQDGSAGTVIFLEFQGALTLTHSSNLILPNNGQSIVTAAGDTCVFICESSGVWRCWIYQRADGRALQEQGIPVDFTPANVTFNSSDITAATFTKAFYIRRGNYVTVKVNMFFDTSDWVNTGGVGQVLFDPPIATTATLGITNTFGFCQLRNIPVTFDISRIIVDADTGQLQFGLNYGAAFANPQYLSIEWNYPLS